MKYKDWSEYKVYCSKINYLMSRPKGYLNLNKKETLRLALLTSKPILSIEEQEKVDFLVNKRKLFFNPPVLSASAINFLVEMYPREKYGLRNASMGLIQSASRTKGFALEKEGLHLLSLIDNVEYKKEVDSLSDSHFIGICDTLSINTGKILDVKTSWNAANFMKTRTENFKLPTEMWSQMQGYLHLYNKSVGEVCFVLVNTPQHLIEQEYATLFKRYSYGEINKEKYDDNNFKLDAFFDYNKIPQKRRVVRFEVHYSKEYISRVKERVEMARRWLLDFDKRFMSTKTITTSAETYLHPDDSETENEEAIT